MPSVAIRLVGIPSVLFTKDKEYSKTVTATYEWMIPVITTAKLTTLRMDLAQLSTSGLAEKQTVTNEEVGGVRTTVVTVRLTKPVLRQALMLVNKFVTKATR